MSLTSFLDILYQYILNISNLYNLNKNMSLASKTKCEIMFSDPESEHIYIYFFQLRTSFIFCLFSCVVIINLFRGGQGVGIYSKLIPD